MAIVKMRKLNLVATSYERETILNALQSTGAVEVTTHEETENTVVLQVQSEEMKNELSSLEASLFSLAAQVENYEKENGLHSGVLKDGFDVSYEEFSSAYKNKEGILAFSKRINELTDERNALKAELAKTAKDLSNAEIYKNLEKPFAYFTPTAHTGLRLGVLPTQNLEGLKTAIAERELSYVETLAQNSENALCLVAAHKSDALETDSLLSAFAFSDCPYKGEKTGAEIYCGLQEKRNTILRELQANEYAVYELKDGIRPLKVYCDYLSFQIEKAEISEKLRGTQSTFLLQAYLPEDAEENVKNTLEGVTSALFMQFSDPTEAETPPTLLKNNAIVSNFESITNTYSAPNYREFDPNPVMAFFYSLFMGFIIGDGGYGVLMALIGGYLWQKGRTRATGLSKLAGAFAVGGVFAVLWGALFNSFFGMPILPFTVMPDPQKDMWSLAGISVPSVLIIAMEVGVSQLCVGYVCKAVQEWRRGNILDGICDGVLWALFSIGVGLAIVGFVDEAGVPALGVIGGITAGATLLLAMLTAGRHEKFFGKFTKGFGAAYGVINYASDILSYARLYGLMLSGAVIAKIVSDYGIQFLTGGQPLMMILGLVILLVGHAFNLVMSLLGAYIHDARLQYVEFYGRFFEGEGELFRPLGSEHKYVYLFPKTNEESKQQLTA